MSRAVSKRPKRYELPMISGAHVLLYSSDEEVDRAFFRDVLRLPSVDAGGGWLIFALPPAEAALHPLDDTSALPRADHSVLGAALYLMCDDLRSVMRSLAAKNVRCTPVEKEPWGMRTTIVLPSGGELGLYQPTHPTAITLSATSVTFRAE